MQEQPQSVGDVRTVSAFNSARFSNNIIHSDEYARSRGFRGGLVPGSDSCGYLSHLAVNAWGLAWLRAGQASFRLISPVYEGDAATAEVTASDASGFDATLTVDGVCCARASFKLAHGLQEDSLAHVERLPLTDSLIAATPEGLSVGTMLPEVSREISQQQARDILDELREDLPVYQTESLIHPGYLIRMANWAFSNTVQLGPWVHVGSELNNFRPCPAGSRITAFSRVIKNFDNKGHRFVTLDIRIHADGIGLVSQVLHTAIYQLRPDAT